MKVLFITQYGYLAASSRTRVFQFLPYLRNAQIHYRVITVLPDRGIAGSQIQVTRHQWRKLIYYLWALWRTIGCGLQAWGVGRNFEVLFIQKVIFPAPIRWLLRLLPAVIVFDFDDAIFTSEVRQASWLARWKKRRNSAGLPAMLRLAGCALVENEYTATFAARYCAQVEVITGPIDTERYTAKQVERDNNKAEIVLGWIGSATTLPYLELIRDPLERLGRRCTHVRLQVIGAEYIDWSGIRVDAKAWNLAEEVEDLEGFDIGLMPIPDDPWTRGKGGYKLLQYMAMGLPVVTSPVGINREIVENGKSGYWACESQQWEACLGRLIDDEGLRRRMGQHGRSVVETRYALDVQAQRLVDLLHGLKNKVEG
jgi:glycosyltransferase involved in cell wall biosynthesis